MMRSVVNTAGLVSSAGVATQVRHHWMNPNIGRGSNKGDRNYEADRAKDQAELAKKYNAAAQQEAVEQALNDERLAAKDVQPQQPYFARGSFAPAKPHEGKLPNEPDSPADTLKMPEYSTAFGKFETTPPTTHSGGRPGLDMHGVIREEPNNTTHMSRITGLTPLVEGGHHPFYDYTSDTGDREGYNTKMAQAHIHWNEKVSMHGLYRASIRGLPLIKHFYYMLIPLDTMKRRIRERFEANKHVKDREAIRMLLHMGWQDYTEIISFRRTKQSVHKHFMDDESQFDLMKHYSNEEGQQLEERRIHNGGYQGKEGPYDGFWSKAGQQASEEFEKLEGRIPVSYSASKGYFEVWKPDGTHFWEKNMDYEGWYVKNVDPDRAAARKEIAAWVEAGYNQPKHYASKNRRAYRRFVRDMDSLMNMTTHEAYAATRENMFHMWIRDNCPESNRLYAEKKLALNDDNVFTMKFDEHDVCFRQAVREFPNPRLWKTDAFWLRMRQLTAGLEYNWAKAPIGAELEKSFNEWISHDLHWTVYNSKAFSDIKADKQRNPMAKTWADFYAEFDPDVLETRRLPWYHKDFDYDRRHFWDERCMRMKKWIQSGDIDSKNDFFQKEVAYWEQMVNRPETFRKPESVEYKYTAPRMTQLYRSLGKRMDMALVNQIAEHLLRKNASLGSDSVRESHGNEKVVEQLQKAIDACDFSDFTFDVPAVIYPDNMDQPKLAADGRPLRVAA
jgi:hypothetical protein